MSMTTDFVFIPSVRKGNGSGHLRRSLDLIGKFSTGALYVPPAETAGRKPEETLPWRILASAAGVPVLETAGSRPPGGPKTAAVIDFRKTPSALLEALPAGWTRLGVDEGGVCRDCFDYLIDTFPVLRRGRECNIQFLPLTGRVRPRRTAERGGRRAAAGTDARTLPESVLISFGGEDAAGLTWKVYSVLRDLVSPGRVTVVEPPFAAFRGKDLPDPAPNILKSPNHLSRKLHRYELVITHFGLTAYEAADAGCRVLCVNPSRYHQRLARAAGFPTVRSRRALRRGIVRAYRQASPAAREDGSGRKPYLGELKEMIEPPARRSCPVCGSFKRSRPCRFPYRTYFVCGECGITYVLSFSLKRQSYGEEYFFEEYQRQYGRSYIDDLPHIIEISKPRAEIIRGLVGTPKRLLDAGCAFGGFLAAAGEAGFRCYGTDISEAAVVHIKKNTEFPAFTASFGVFDSEQAFGVSAFQAVTMWFVLEHFQDTGKVLKKCYRLLETGGVLGLSLPNSGGISGRKDRRKFLEDSPEDHCTVWDPRSAKKVLRMYGFEPEAVRMTGHHPERFPGCSGLVPGGRLYTLLTLVSRVFRLGDTFEIYARKQEGKRE